MIREILQMGDARLLRQAEPVTQFDMPELHALVQDMFDTMRASNGVGLAAPQIGVNLRVVVFGFERNARYPDEAPVPNTVLINPHITFADSVQEEALEGCLSVPGMRGSVMRYKQLHYSAHDVYGKNIEGIAEGFHARVIQHECDHLDGILYPTRVSDRSKLRLDTADTETARHPEIKAALRSKTFL